MEDPIDIIRDLLPARNLSGAPDNRALAELNGSTVLVTGAGGSIGSALAKQLVRCGLVRLILVDYSEGSLFDVGRELPTLSESTSLSLELCDITNRGAMARIFDRFRPKIVFHAAAFKHVPLLETQPFAAIYNNVTGTSVVAELAAEYEVSRMVVLSSDKAVNPTSILGASKRTCELITACASRNKTTAVSVRFGNVIGSRGSVFSIFADALRTGKQLTVTAKGASRYLIDMNQAVGLLINATWLGSNGSVLVPDLGEAVQIVDIAQAYRRASGSNDVDNEGIVFTSLRDGEKLSEELYSASEERTPTPVEYVSQIARPDISAPLLDGSLRLLSRSISNNDLSGLINEIRILVPEYRPSELVLSLIQ